MNNIWIRVGICLCGLGVAMGAFGAHGLQAMVSERALEWFSTGVDYQVWHGAALIMFGLWESNSGSSTPAIGWLFCIGVALFTGSLVAMSLTGVTKLGMITPLGGLSFLAAWGAWAYVSLRRNK